VVGPGQVDRGGADRSDSRFGEQMRHLADEDPFQLGLEFVGFEFDRQDAPRKYRARYPGDAAAASFDNWADFEASEPDTFSAMYQFWVRR